MIADHERTFHVDTVLGNGFQTHSYLRLPAVAMVIRSVGTVENIIYATSAGLDAADHLVMDRGQRVLIEVTATEPGLVGYDYHEETRIVETLDGRRHIGIDLECIRVAAIRNVLGEGVVTVDEDRLLTEHLPLDDAAYDVVGAEVRLLDAGRLLRGDDHGTVDHILHDTAVTCERDGLRTPLLGCLQGKDDVFGIAGCGHSYHDIALPAVGLDLSLEDEVVAVVVADGGYGCDVGKTDAGQRRALHPGRCAFWARRRSVICHPASVIASVASSLGMSRLRSSDTLRASQPGLEEANPMKSCTFFKINPLKSYNMLGGEGISFVARTAGARE